MTKEFNGESKMACKPNDVVMTKYFGPCKLRKLYAHRDTKEMVWDVASKDGSLLHLSQRYVQGLEVISRA